jgi:hypothetical protein
MDRNLPAGDFNGAGRDIEIITRPSTTTIASDPEKEKKGSSSSKMRDIEVFTRPSALKPSADFYQERPPPIAGSPPAAVSSTLGPPPRGLQDNLAAARAKLKNLEAQQRPEINSKIREINNFFVGTKDLRYSDAPDKPYVSLLGMFQRVFLTDSLQS